MFHLGDRESQTAWFVCSDLTWLWVLRGNYCSRWYHNAVAHVLQAWFEVPVCVGKLGGEPRKTIFTAKLWSLVYGWGEDCFLDVGARFRDNTRTYFVLTTDPKVRECGFIPGILASVLKWNELGFPLSRSSAKILLFHSQLFWWISDRWPRESDVKTFIRTHTFTVLYRYVYIFVCILFTSQDY